MKGLKSTESSPGSACRVHPGMKSATSCVGQVVRAGAGPVALRARRGGAVCSGSTDQFTAAVGVAVARLLAAWVGTQSPEMSTLGLGLATARVTASVGDRRRLRGLDLLPLFALGLSAVQ